MMKRIRKSRFIRVLSLVLSILFLSLTAFNVFLFFEISDNNLFHVGKDAFSKKLYSFATEYTANDLWRYLSLKIDEEHTDYQYYNSTELELYQNKYDKQHSNAAFVIRNSKGNTVLTNFEPENILREYTWQISLPVYYTTDNNADKPKEEPATNSEPTTAEASESSKAKQNKRRSESFATTAMPGVTDVTDAQTTQSETEVYIESSPDNEYILKYIFPKGMLNERIYQYIQGLYDGELNFDITEYASEIRQSAAGAYAIVYQDDFMISANGVVYYTPEDSEADTTFYETDHEEYPEDTEYEEYSATIYVPKSINPNARDIYYYFSSLIDSSFAYCNHIIPFSVTFLIAGILLLLLYLTCCGHYKNETEPKAKGLHRIPTDIFLIADIALFSAVGALIVEFADSFFQTTQSEVVFYMLSVPPIVLTGVFLLVGHVAVQIKCRRMPDCFCLIKLFKNLFGLIKKATDNAPLLVKCMLIFAGTTFIEIIVILGVDSHQDAPFIILYLIYKASEIIALLLIIINLNILQQGVKEISGGNMDHKVENRLLFGAFRKHAGYLNSINDGISKEVAERVRSESTKTELITNVSHDLKTPLTSIINYIGLLSAEKIENEKAREYVSVIDRQAQRLKKLTTDIVDASKAAAGSIEVNYEKTDLNVFISQVNGEYEDKLSNKELELVCELPEEEIYAMTDGRLLWRVFENLMNNIAKYSLKGTRVYVSLVKTDDKAVITFRNISETKLNISPEELTERFVRGDESRNTEGSGLGLSIAKSLIELMKGQMDIRIDGDLFKIILTFKTA